MVQSVFDIGDPITSRLKLGVTPDGTTSATVSVRRPDGTALTGLIVSAWGGTDGDEKTVQWFATNDGSAGAATSEADGDWLAVWTVTGKGASVTAKVYSVYPLPGTGERSRLLGMNRISGLRKFRRIWRRNTWKYCPGIDG